MLYFGRHVLNEGEILRIDLWFGPDIAKVYFIGGESITLDSDAAYEARAWAEDNRRLGQLEIQNQTKSLEEFLTRNRKAEGKNARRS